MGSMGEVCHLEVSKCITGKVPGDPESEKVSQNLSNTQRCELKEIIVFGVIWCQCFIPVLGYRCISIKVKAGAKAFSAKSGLCKMEAGKLSVPPTSGFMTGSAPVCTAVISTYVCPPGVGERPRRGQPVEFAPPHLLAQHGVRPRRRLHKDQTPE